MSGGGPLGPWSLPTNQLDIAKRQSRLLGCPEDTSEKIINCLRTIPAEKFYDSLFQLRVSLFSVIERNLTSRIPLVL